MSNWWEQAAAAAMNTASNALQKASDHVEAQGGLGGMVGTAKSTVTGMDNDGKLRRQGDGQPCSAQQRLQNMIASEKTHIEKYGNCGIILENGEEILRVIEDMQIDCSDIVRCKVRGRGVITNYRFILKIFKTGWEPCVW